MDLRNSAGIRSCHVNAVMLGVQKFGKRWNPCFPVVSQRSERLDAAWLNFCTINLAL